MQQKVIFFFYFDGKIKEVNICKLNQTLPDLSYINSHVTKTNVNGDSVPSLTLSDESKKLGLPLVFPLLKATCHRVHPGGDHAVSCTV